MINNHKILFVSSEVTPFVKTGGLADVSGELPKALKNLGCDIRIILPLYSAISKEQFNIKSLNININITLGDTTEKAEIYKTIINDIPVYFIHNENYFDRNFLYGSPEQDYPDNDKRFIFFSRAILESLPLIDFVPDIIHTNDWQTGLIPLYLKHFYHQYKTRSVFTIHNLAYQGLFPKSALKLTGLSEDYFSMSSLEFYEKVCFIKSGIVYADKVTTVSPTYAEEIKTKELGCGLDGLLQLRSEDLSGIINGLDYNDWNPNSNNIIKCPYNEKKIGNKKFCKSDLQFIQNLPINQDIPIIAMISRITEQKGFDILLEIFDELMIMNLQFVLLGKGEKKYEKQFLKYALMYPQKVAINYDFLPNLSFKIYSGADIFLMPSRYEPCGLGQLISMKFGTIPIVRNTGGLKDTVLNFNGTTGTGFTFNEFNSTELLSSIKEALKVYKNQNVWKDLIYNAMTADFSWENSALKYLELYNSLLN